MEYLDIVDENGLPTGRTVARDTAHSEGIRHRTAHVWIVRGDKARREVLLQKRSMEKESFPGLYDTSSAGHIPAGDEPLMSALRELKEELGISASALYRQVLHRLCKGLPRPPVQGQRGDLGVHVHGAGGRFRPDAAGFGGGRCPLVRA